MDSVVLSPLNSIETHLNALITSLTQTNTFSTAPQLAQDLLTDDDNLTSALSLLYRHQQNYARILNLREEVSTLQEHLKDTIRKCVAFKTEIGEINPSILESDLEDDDEGDDEEPDASKRTGEVAEVDYHTLLTFAARIGKHNTLAAKEAENEAIRRRISSKPASSSTANTQNGIPPTETQPTQDSSATTTTGTARHENNTAETTAELLRIDADIALRRAQMGMSFPEAPTLRLGALGQLQLFRERAEQSILGANGMQDNDEDTKRKVQEAVDQEVARMVRETEDIAPEVQGKDIGEADVEEGLGIPESPVLGRRDTPSTFVATAAAGRASTSQAGGSAHEAQRPPRPPQQKKKLDLDFPSSDEDDDDDD